MSSITASRAPVACSIAPWLSVPDGAKAVDFYKSAFGAAEVYRLENPRGVVARLSVEGAEFWFCLLYTSPSPRDGLLSRMPSSA